MAPAPAPRIQLDPEKVQELTEFARTKLGQIWDRSLAEFPNPDAFNHARSLFKNEPAKYAQIYQELISGQPPSVVQFRIDASYDAICEIRRLYPEVITAGRQQIVHNLEEASLMFSNRLVTEGHTLGIDKVAQNLAILIEKTQLLTGGVTSRQEHLSAPKPEDLKAMFDQLPEANAEIVEPIMQGNATDCGTK